MNYGWFFFDGWFLRFQVLGLYVFFIDVNFLKELLHGGIDVIEVYFPVSLSICECGGLWLSLGLFEVINEIDVTGATDESLKDPTSSQLSQTFADTSAFLLGRAKFRFQFYYIVLFRALE
jgi:hypothetical protein